MNRLEKISQLSNQQDIIRQQAEELRIKSLRDAETRAQFNLQKAQTTLKTLNIQSYLEEIRDTVWQMGSVTCSNNTLFTTPEVSISLVAQWPTYRPARTEYWTNKSSDSVDEESRYCPATVELRREEITVSASSASYQEMNLKISNSKLIKAYTVPDPDTQPINQNLLDEVDKTLSEICLAINNGKPLTERAAADRNSLIEHLRAGDVAKDNVPPEFQQYLPPSAAIPKKRKGLFG